MGNKFVSQISVYTQQQTRWVPRSSDMNGGGEQGGELVMLTYGEEALFNALVITDTTAHQSLAVANDNPEGVPYDQVYAVYKTALVTSTLNQAVALQPIWSRDRATWYSFGTATNVIAYGGTGPAQTGIIALSTPSQYLPYVGLIATCATAPTSGALNGWLERLG